MVKKPSTLNLIFRSEMTNATCPPFVGWFESISQSDGSEFRASGPLFQQIFSWRAAIQDTLGRGRARRESDLGRECHARRFHAERLRQCAGRPQASRAIHPRRSRRIRAAPHPGNLLDGRATTRRDAPRLRGAEGRSTGRYAPDARVIRRWLRLGQHAGARLPSRAPGCARPRPPDTMTTQPCASSPENPRTHR